ncbi:MAG: TonB-dependent receptor plug domain-containing protein [Chitinophagales bacterium]|nr:TonB-dependent receptor plug domain-containing protein [Chitinophagales bacterium]
MQKILCYILTLFLVNTGIAQTTVTGKLIDAKTKEPIESAVIKYAQKNLLTNKEGAFSVPYSHENTRILITAIGYKSKQIQLNDTAKNVIELESAILNLTEVVVAAPGFNQSLQQIISKIDLNLRPAKSSQELLRFLPGLFIAQHQGGGKAEQIFLRGFDIDHGTDIAITVDGMPVNMVSHAHGQGYADLHFLIPETIKNIDYGTGPYYAAQGNFNTAGYAAFETKNKLEQNQVQVEAGMFETVRTLGMFQLLNKQKHQAYIASEYLYSNGPFQSPQHFNRFNIFGKYNWQLHEKNSLQFIASTFDSKWDASGQIPQRAVAAGLIDRFGAIDDTEGGTTGRSNLSVKWKHSNSNFTIHQQIFYSRYQFDLFSNFTFFLNDPVNGDQIRQREKRDVLGYNASLQTKRHYRQWTITSNAGWGLRADKTYASELSQTLAKETVLERKALGNVKEINAFAYASQNYSSGKWMFNPAVRVDYFSFAYADALNPSLPSQQKAVMSPKLNVFYNYSKQVQLFIKSGKGFHSNDTRVVVPNNGSQILPAAYGADAGVVLKALKNLIITTSAWYLYLQQEFVYVGDEAVVEQGGKTQRLGFDVSGRYQFIKNWLVDVNINYAHARDLQSAKGEDFIPLAPQLTSIGGISYQSKQGFNGSLRYRFLKDRPANSNNSITAKGYFITDLSFNYTKRMYEIGFIVENLFNTKWNEAQFETTSRLRDEPMEVTELHFTPGVPFFAKLRLSIFF